MIQELFSKTFIRFALVGCVNTLVGGTIMFVLYNVFQCSYWFSSACNYVLASIVSYFLNKRFTFRCEEKRVTSFLRFAVNIAACYVVAYAVAKPLVKMVLSQVGQNLQENIAMIVGMALFMVCNFFGQKHFVFRKK